MTVKELYAVCLNELNKHNVENAQFECDCLFEHFTAYNKVARITKSDRLVEAEKENALFSAVKQRIDGKPLQYILGSWGFMGYDFKVGEGVLIPRPETELLVEKASEVINKHNSNCIVYDLCAGSGAIGLSIAKLHPECQVYLFEKYDGAFSYLKQNAEAMNCKNVRLVKYDIFDGCNAEFPKADLILSNPPYINSEEIPTLQPEVQKEPITALDGGNDGLDFYRCIYEKWICALNKNACVIMECGENQSKDIIDIFSEKSTDFEVCFDFNDIDRVVKINV